MPNPSATRPASPPSAKNPSPPTKAFQRQESGLRISRKWRDEDEAMVARALEGFAPKDVFDAHSHLLHSAHFSGGEVAAFLQPGEVLGLKEYQTAMKQILRGRKVASLQFGYPVPGADLPAVNAWVAEEAGALEGNFHLSVVPPNADPTATDALLAAPGCKGAKVYHLLTGRPDSYDCRIEDFAPEWLWELVHARRQILMLHMVRDRAVADAENIASIRRLAGKYPGCRLVLAHLARSFCHRHARDGMAQVADLDNVSVDTSAVTEPGAFQVALETFGPSRILYGSDYPFCLLRGRCVTLADSFFWLHDLEAVPALRQAGRSMTLVGLESLLCLREACEDFGTTPADIAAIFSGNARRILKLDPEQAPPDASVLWRHAREVITCGTGLLSKRREQFDALEWPAYFSRCKGSRVWDLAGRSYLDMAGGVGAILLGYSDPDVNRRVRRRMGLGGYCTLVSPEEIELAELLLALNPWAGQVRYARAGGEAVAMAVRIARAATGRSGILFCGYHGWHDWYLAANLGSESALDGHLLPGLRPLGVPRELLGTSHPFRYNNWESFESALAAAGDNFASVVMEPMRSEWPRDNFLERVRDAAHRRGAVFVLDEVTSGWRFGFPGAHTTLGITPDVAVYAKAMSNGFPCAAIVGTHEVMSAAEQSFISSSFWTDGVGTAAALATIRKLGDEDVFAHVNRLGAELKSGLEALAQSHPTLNLVISGMPPSPNFRFDLGELSHQAKVWHIRAMLERGFLVSPQLFLFHSHTQAHVRDYLSALDETLSQMEALLANGALAKVETGAPANPFARLA